MFLQLLAASWGLTPWLQKSMGLLGLGPELFAVTLAIGDPELKSGIGGIKLVEPDSYMCLVLLRVPWQVFQTEMSNMNA